MKAPLCPDCKTPTVIPTSRHQRAGEFGDKNLVCVACGIAWVGPAGLVAALERREARISAALARKAKQAAKAARELAAYQRAMREGI